MSTARLTIESANIAPTVLTNYHWPGEFSDKPERDQVFYRREFKGEIVLKGDDYALVNDLTDVTEEITLTVERKCDGVYTEFWTGVAAKFDGKFDHDRCTVALKFKPEDNYRCLYDAWETAHSIYAAGPEFITRGMAGTYQLGDGNGADHCQAESNMGPIDFDAECGTPAGWCVEHDEQVLLPIGGVYVGKRFYHREIGTGTLTDPPAYGTGWTHLSGTTWWRCPDIDEQAIGVLRYGREFADVFQYLVDESGCGLTVRSHFFGIAATHAAPPSNDAYTYAAAKYQLLSIHQKSDVKRPDASNESTEAVWSMKLKELLDDLRRIFNVYWRIDGTDLIVEHITYFTTSAGADYSAQNIRQVKTYDLDAPKREEFYWADDACSTAFKGSPITYAAGSNTTTHRVANFSTDVAFIRTPENHGVIADAGFVLLCNTQVAGKNVIIELNAPLSWEALHDNLHRDYRPFLAGTLNGVGVTFNSARPSQVYEPFTVCLPCDEDIDPSQYITTEVGNGYVAENTINILKDSLELKLKYE